VTDLIAHFGTITALLVVSIGGIFIKRQVRTVLRATLRVKNQQSARDGKGAQNDEHAVDRVD